MCFQTNTPRSKALLERVLLPFPAVQYPVRRPSQSIAILHTSEFAVHLYRPGAGGIAGSSTSKRPGFPSMIGNRDLQGRSFTQPLKA